MWAVFTREKNTSYSYPEQESGTTRFSYQPMASGSGESDDGASSFKVARRSLFQGQGGTSLLSRPPGPHLFLEGQL